MDYISNAFISLKQRVSGAFSSKSEPTAENIMSFEEGQQVAQPQMGGKRKRNRKQKSKKGKKSKSASKKYKSRKHGKRR